ncbi:MAG: alpha-2-macroglobulin [Prevotellaceae bacterium]|jgi:uncharacterized protein YfaS (alpha-2-macroglobulin family)|nr:alpha-2-macroglobulin [Prevotellaceae bacterium]
MKKIIRLSLALLLGIMATLFLFSCKTKVINPSADFAPYISGYTGGVIYNTSSIIIELTDDNSIARTDTVIDEKLFAFTPSIKGSAYRRSNRTIEFVPEAGQLKSGTLYNAKFNLGKVKKDVNKKLRSFEFSFRVEKQNFIIKTGTLDISSSNPNIASLSGELRFSDKAGIDNVRKMIKAENDGFQQKISVKETSNPKIFAFSIDSIQRKSYETELHISIDGKSVDVKKVFEENIKIPSGGTFEVLDARLISEPENGVQITLSNPVLSSQDLTGLFGWNISNISNLAYDAVENKIFFYFEQSGQKDIEIGISKAIKDYRGKHLEEDYYVRLISTATKPQVKIENSGVILPDSKNLTLPFRAVNIRAVDLKVIQIFEKNVLMFMQNNTLSGTEELRRAGRLVHKQTLNLDTDPTKDLHSWNNFSIDLANLFKKEQGAIYRIQLSFKKDYSVYPCSSEQDETAVSNNPPLTRITSDEISEQENETWDRTETYYYSDDDDAWEWDEYDWTQTDNPCHPSYYMSSYRTSASCNVVASNLGLIAKSNSNKKWWIAVSDILTTKPIKNAKVTIYNFQLQPIGSQTTDGDGFAEIDATGKGFVAVAESGKEKTYLRLVEGEDNSLSRFDVGGEEIKKGMKGFIYGERGVWRPGDTISLTFILQTDKQNLPSNHPVTLEVFNARGQFNQKQIKTQGINGFYAFAVPTKDTDPTGLWHAYVKIGGATFHKALRVETIKPNRLKISFDVRGTRLDAYKKSIPANLSATWLTGATARKLKTEVEMSLSKKQTSFKGYEKYSFNNPACDFSTLSEQKVFSGTLNDEGNVDFNMSLPAISTATGMLNANIVCRVFEQGGDASIYTQTLPFSPYKSYVGIDLKTPPQGKYLETDMTHTFNLVTLDADGKPVNSDNLEYSIYKIDWSWWWDRSEDSFSGYINSASYKPAASGTLSTINGKSKIDFRIDYPEWGRYLVYVKDKTSGHACGGVIYLDWPESRGRSNKTEANGIKLLSFYTDKTIYETGEYVTVTIPASAEGNALVSLENGTGILSRTWVKTGNGDTKYKFKVTPEMSPNFYIHISLLQAHEQTVNDLPIRMYGIMPVFVNNKNSKLEPVIAMPDVLRPETEFTVSVNEKNGKAMTYTLAIVDEGLLDLTNFKTPDAWNTFYAREALGIRTWDMFDLVMGASAGAYSPMFSVGGDADSKPANTKANRFRPVVKYLGPFELGKGKTNKHKITLPVYVGSVRAMIVAGQDAAYGKTEKTVPVRTPLMTLSSLPRVISTDEEISLPINVFAMENDVKQVTVKVETSGLLKAAGSNSKTINFKQPGDETVYFSFKTGIKTGIEKVTVTASGNGHSTKETIEIDVRNPNPPVIQAQSLILEASQSGEMDYALADMSQESWVKLETSRIPSVDISLRYDFLYSYQHYCSEQLTSRAFPLLYIPLFKDVDKDESEKIKTNVREGIKNLYTRQLSNGGFVYWAGSSQINDWITSYAGNFLVAAKERGYEVNEGVLKRWKNYQQKTAQNFSSSSAQNSFSNYSELQQAYRLYTLALAGSPELGAMNRLKESGNLSIQTRWRLASAYAVCGKIKVAEELVRNVSTQIEKYDGAEYYTYGSFDRDEAMILETLVLMGRIKDAFGVAQEVSASLSRETSFSTQSTAFALVAMGSLAEKMSGSLDYSWKVNGNAQKAVKSAKAIVQHNISTKTARGKVSITNTGKGAIYANLVCYSRPAKDTLPETSHNLNITVSYTDINGNTVNVSSLSQGTDFYANIKVANTGFGNYYNLALSCIIPSGWEIFNSRYFDREENNEESNSNSSVFDYQDIRDDRVLTYFSLQQGQSKTINIRLQTSYLGSFVLPAVLCEAMYDTSVFARTKARRVEVVR